jgi:hypothetical protein
MRHPQVYSSVLAMAVVVAWVHWRKPVSELKLNPWAAVVILALLFRPAIIELLRRMNKISMSGAEITMQALSMEAEQGPEGGTSLSNAAIKNVAGGNTTIGMQAGKITGRVDFGGALPGPSSVAQKAQNLLERIADPGDLPRSLDPSRLGRRLRVLMDAAAAMILSEFNYPGDTETFSRKAAWFLARETGLQGWESFAAQWRLLCTQYESIFTADREKNPFAIANMTLWNHVAERTLAQLRSLLTRLAARRSATDASDEPEKK